MMPVFFNVDFMKRFSFSLLLVFLATHAHSEISEDWLDDDILFDSTQSQTLTIESNEPEQETTQSEESKPSANTSTTSNESDVKQDEQSIVEDSQNDSDTQSTAVPSNNDVNESSNSVNSANSNQSNNEAQQLDNVVIKAQTDKTSMTQDTQKLFSMPGSAGDPLKGLSALPGINSASSFQGAPSVRGSAPADNTILVDNLPVANLYHLLGYSIFSDNIVQNFDIQTGAFPAKYAGGTGAAIYVDLREPKTDPISFVLDLGMFHSGVFVESKINDNQSLYFGARKSTISFFAPFLISDDEPEPVDEDESQPPIINQFPNSDDLYFKYTNKINDQNKFNFLIIGAQDYAGIEFPEGSGVEDNEPALLGELAVNTKQATTGGNWIYQPDKDNRFDTSLGHLFFNLDIILGDGYYTKLLVNSLIAKTNYQKTNIDSHILSAGMTVQSDNADYEIRTLNTPCTDLEEDCPFTSGVLVEATDNTTINYFDGFVEDQWFINDELTWTNGLHISYDDYIQDAIIQPRSKLEFNWYDEWIISGAFGLHHQVPEITNLLPKLGNPNLKNITALHYVFGVEKNTYSGLKIKADTYYKK